MKVYKKDEINRDKNNGRQQSNLVAVNKSRLPPPLPTTSLPSAPPPPPRVRTRRRGQRRGVGCPTDLLPPSRMMVHLTP